MKGNIMKYVSQGNIKLYVYGREAKSLYLTSGLRVISIYRSEEYDRIGSRKPPSCREKLKPGVLQFKLLVTIPTTSFRQVVTILFCGNKKMFRLNTDVISLNTFLFFQVRIHSLIGVIVNLL